MIRNKRSISLIIVIITVSAGLLFYRLSELMPLFGDQSWFYLSARDMVLTGNVPFVGIPSSHPWLHQGPFWIYILAGIFSLTHFDPLAPGYVTAGVGVITVGLVYLVGKRIFSANVGLIAAFLYATSPLVIITARSPYHTSFIPLLTLAFLFSLYKWLSGSSKYFPLSIFFIACLYNFEIATTPFSLILFLCLAYGIWKKKKFATLLANKKTILLSIIAWLIPMIPMLLYDRTHGFPQTVKFVLWLGYRFAKLFGFPDIHGDTVFAPLAPFLPFTITKIQHLIFLPQQWIAIALLLAAFLSLSYFLYHSIKAKKTDPAVIALFLTFTLPFLSYFALHTSSEAYWPMFFPATMLMIAFGVDKLLQNKHFFLISLIGLLAVGSLNGYFLVKENYLMNYQNYGYPMSKRLDISREIITQAKGREYTIIGKGAGSTFASFVMPYTYLTWWLGHGPSPKTEKLRFYFTETESGISLNHK